MDVHHLRRYIHFWAMPQPDPAETAVHASSGSAVSRNEGAAAASPASRSACAGCPRGAPAPPPSPSTVAAVPRSASAACDAVAADAMRPWPGTVAPAAPPAGGEQEIRGGAMSSAGAASLHGYETPLGTLDPESPGEAPPPRARRVGRVEMIAHVGGAPVEELLLPFAGGGTTFLLALSATVGRARGRRRAHVSPDAPEVRSERPGDPRPEANLGRSPWQPTSDRSPS
jgi:hypothetical protein